MNTWSIYSHRSGNLNMLHRAGTGETSECGQMRHDTPKDMIIDWIVHQDALRPGDLISFDDGTRLQVFYEQNAVA